MYPQAGNFSLNKTSGKCQPKSRTPPHTIRSQFGCVLFPRRRRGNNTKEQPFCIISNTYQNWETINYEYDYPFSTPTKNAVNKRIIERPISFPRLRRGKDNRQLYSTPDITSFILVYQRDDHITNYRSTAHVQLCKTVIFPSKIKTLPHANNYEL